MARQARCNRVHSAVTHQVNVIEAGKGNVHAAFLKLSSGQLPFLGLERHKQSMTGFLKLLNFGVFAAGCVSGVCAESIDTAAYRNPIER